MSPKARLSGKPQGQRRHVVRTARFNRSVEYGRWYVREVPHSGCDDRLLERIEIQGRPRPVREQEQDVSGCES